MATTISAKVVQFLDKVLFKQTDLVTNATYKQHNGTTYSSVLKRSVDTFTDVAVTAVSIGDLTGKHRPSKGDQPVRGRGYVIRSSEMPTGYKPEEALNDLLVLNSKEYKVVEVEKILEVAYFVKVEL